MTPGHDMDNGNAAGDDASQSVELGNVSAVMGSLLLTPLPVFVSKLYFSNSKSAFCLYGKLYFICYSLVFMIRAAIGGLVWLVL